MNEPMTSERERAIRAREQAATPGLWGTRRDLVGTYTIQHGARVTFQEGFASDGDVAVLFGDDKTAYSNGQFIVHARRDIPDLLAEIDRLRGLAEEKTTAPAAAVTPASGPVCECGCGEPGQLVNGHYIATPTTEPGEKVTPEPEVTVEDVARLNPRQRGLLDEIVKHGGTWTKQAATYLYQRKHIHQAERKAREDLAKLARIELLTRLPEAAGCDRYQLPGGTA